MAMVCLGFVWEIRKSLFLVLYNGFMKGFGKVLIINGLLFLAGCYMITFPFLFSLVKIRKGS